MQKSKWNTICVRTFLHDSIISHYQVKLVHVLNTGSLCNLWWTVFPSASGSWPALTCLLRMVHWQQASSQMPMSLWAHPNRRYNHNYFQYYYCTTWQNDESMTRLDMICQQCLPWIVRSLTSSVSFSNSSTIWALPNAHATWNLQQATPSFWLFINTHTHASWPDTPNLWSCDKMTHIDFNLAFNAWKHS